MFQDNIFYTQQTHTAPEVLSLADAKKQVKMEDFTYDDALITTYIEAAIDVAENYTNTSIRERKYKATMFSWKNYLELKRQKVTTIDSIQYLDEDGVTQTLSTDEYELLPIDKYASVIHFPEFDDLPEVKDDASNAITISFTIGYAANTVPEGMLQGIKLYLTDIYTYRSDRNTKDNTSAKVLLEPYRYYSVPDVNYGS